MSASELVGAHVGTITYRQELRRCGNPACTRCRDGPAHGPYWYAYSRDDAGRLHSRYCGKTRPPGVVERPARGRPTVPSLATPQPPPLRIRLLGGFNVERGGMPLSAREWPRAGARALLALLALHPAGLPREEIGEALWPEQGAPEATLKTTLTVLRRILEPPDPAATHYKSLRLPHGERTVCLRLWPHDWIDIHAFTTAADPTGLSLAALENIAGLYAGELLPEYRYAGWTATARETLRGRWQALSLRLAQRLAEAGLKAGAIERLRAILAGDGTQEETARLLMTLLAEQGQRDVALQVYERLVVALERELAVGPDTVSRALAARLRRDDAVALARARSPREVAGRLEQRLARLAVPSPGPQAARRLARLYAERALALESLGEVQQARGSVHSGLLVLAGLDFPAEESRLRLAEALLLYRQGQARAAQEAAMRAGSLAAAAAERGLEAWSLRLQAQAAEALGQPEQAIALAQSSVALYDLMGAPDQGLRSRRVLAFALWRAGRGAEALVLHRHNLQAARALGEPEQVAYVLCGLGQTLLTLGELDAAAPPLLESLALAERLEDHYLLLSVEYHLANLWAERAYLVLDEDGLSLAEAQQQTRERFERVMALARAQGSAHMLSGAACDLAVAYAQWGRPREARPLIALAQQMMAQSGDHAPMQGWLLLSAAELALAEGRSDEALAQAQAALPLLQCGSPTGLAPAHRVAALALRRQGQHDAARPHWDAALGAAVRYGQALEERRTRRALQRG